MSNLQYEGGAISPGDCIGEGWNLVSRQFWLYVGVGLVAMLLVSCVPFVNFFLFGPVFGGFYYLVLKDMYDEPVDFGMLFKGFEKFVPLMVVGLIQSAPSIVITIIQYTFEFARLAGGGALGGGDVNFYQSGSDVAFAGLSMVLVVSVIVGFFVAIIWHFLFVFAIPLVIDQDASIGDALITSAKAALANPGGLIVLVIFQILVMLLGMIAFCIGVFVAIPVLYASNAIAYRQVFLRRRASGFSNVPPPPDVYGFGGGR